MGALALPIGSDFLSWNGDETLRLWDAAGKESLSLHGHEGRVLGALALPDRAGFLSWGEDGMLRICHKDGQLRNLWLSPCGGITHVEAFGKPNHFLVVFGGHVGIVHLPFYG